jgi:hypothetical protein
MKSTIISASKKKGEVKETSGKERNKHRRKNLRNS